MRPLLIGLLAFPLTVSVPHAQAPPGNATLQQINGRVVDARTGAPLRRARVTLTISGRAGDPVFTGDEGRFVIEAPAPPFTVTVAKAGYTSSVVTPSAAELEVPLPFALARSVAVMGRVVDRSGFPAAPTGAYVTARLLPGAGSRESAAPTRFYAETDGLGEYRLGALAAGRYEITAIRIPALQRVNAVGPLEARLFGSTDSFDVARAVTVSIDPGEELHGVDFAVPGAVHNCAPGPPVAAGSRTGTARIRGRVLGPTGEPLVCAQIHVSPDVAPYVPTDAEGRYSLDSLPAGTFVVQAFMPGYLPLRHGQRNPSDQEKAVALRQGERRDGVDITLPREAMVSGTVADEYGEPVEGVLVSALQLLRRNGRVIGAPRAFARATDDRGHYRIIAVPPGTYLISAAATGDLTTNDGSRGYVSSYHPGTTDVQFAGSVVVDAGTDLRNIDVALSPVQTATVTGVVLDPAGHPLAGTVSLMTSARSGAPALVSRSAVTDAGGRFALRSVPPGDYVLKAPVQGGGSPLFGMQYVTVTDGDPEPVILQVSEGTTVEGRLVLEVAPGMNSAPPELTYTSTDFDRDPSVHRSSFVRDFEAGGAWDGTFRVAGIFGPSRLTLPRIPGCDACYLKSAHVNGTNAAETPFDFGLKGGTIRGVEVVVSDAGATIEGRVADESEARAALEMVVMPAWDVLRYAGSPYVQSGFGQSNGRFEAKGLPPGEYIVAATNRDDGATARFEPGDPELGALLATRGTRVTVSERERASVTLRLLRR